MVPTLVIALREGVEASLIVGIVAAFCVKEGRRDALRPMWLGVALAAAMCVAVAIGLRIVGEELPDREQEMLETVIGLIAVGAVTYMIVWMRRHARGLKASLEGHARSALVAGSTAALVKPGTVTGSLLTGMLGLQPKPTVIEAAAYLLYAVPMALYVVWPDRRRARPQRAEVHAQASAAESTA